MKLSRPSFVLVSVVALASTLAEPVSAELRYRDQGAHPWCATGVETLDLAVARHEMFEKRNRRARRAAGGAYAASSGTSLLPTIRKEGPVAVIEDTGGALVLARNPFRHDNEAFEGKRKKKKLRFVRSDAAVTSDRGELITIGDDDSVELALPFSFRFYGKKYRKVFLNSDGNLTFGEADFASTPRSAARVTSGPPRIAPLFADLDPSVAAGDNGVYLLTTNSFVRVTWVQVPEWGTSNENTVQITLFKGGRFVMAYGDVAAAEAVVGAAPGGGSSVELIDYDEDLPTGASNLALLENFTQRSQVDDLAVARAFLGEFRDIYDHIVVWLDFPHFLGGGAFAYHLHLANDIRGIGLGLGDATSQVGSNGRMHSFLQMGSLANYPDDMFQDFLGTNNTLDILGQEAGHRWLSFVGFINDQGSFSTDILGRDLAHWSFNMDSDASDMEGNDIEDNGDGSFTTVGATSRFNRLDQYLMGLIPPAQVPPFFYVANSSRSPSAAPQIGQTFNGTRVDVTVDQVIAAEGPRVPSSDKAKKKFNMAFVLLGRSGEPVRPDSIAKLKKIAKQWRTYFKNATEGNGRIGTKLKIRK